MVWVGSILYGLFGVIGIGYGILDVVVVGLWGFVLEICDLVEVWLVWMDFFLGGMLLIDGSYVVLFVKEDVVFVLCICLLGYLNVMIFIVWVEDSFVFIEEIYYLVGGGFICCDGEDVKFIIVGFFYFYVDVVLLFVLCDEYGFFIVEFVWFNEIFVCSEEEVVVGFDVIWEVMFGCVDVGLYVEGVFFGIFKVK